MELESYFESIQKLKMYEYPDYSVLKELFLRVCARAQEEKLQWLDWVNDLGYTQNNGLC